MDGFIYGYLTFVKIVLVTLAAFVLSTIWVDYDFYKAEYKVTSEEIVEKTIWAPINGGREEWYSIAFTYEKDGETHEYVLADKDKNLKLSSMGTYWISTETPLKQNQKMFLRKKNNISNSTQEVFDRVLKEGIYEVSYFWDIVGYTILFIVSSWLLCAFIYGITLEAPYGVCMLCPLYGVTCVGDEDIIPFTITLKKMSWLFWGYRKEDIDEFFKRFWSLRMYDKTKYITHKEFRNWLKENVKEG